MWLPPPPPPTGSSRDSLGFLGLCSGVFTPLPNRGLIFAEAQSSMSDAFIGPLTTPLPQYQAPSNTQQGSVCALAVCLFCLAVRPPPPPPRAGMGWACSELCPEGLACCKCQGDVSSFCFLRPVTT